MTNFQIAQGLFWVAMFFWHIQYFSEDFIDMGKIMNPSKNFHTGGALIDPQRLGCTGFIVRWGLALSGLIVLFVLWKLT